MEVGVDGPTNGTNVRNGRRRIDDLTGETCYFDQNGSGTKFGKVAGRWWRNSDLRYV